MKNEFEGNRRRINDRAGMTKKQIETNPSILLVVYFVARLYLSGGIKRKRLNGWFESLKKLHGIQVQERGREDKGK